MQLSDDRIAHLSHQILDRLRPLAEIPVEERALREIKRRMIAVLKEDDMIDALARRKIASLKRGMKPLEIKAEKVEVSDEELMNLFFA